MLVRSVFPLLFLLAFLGWLPASDDLPELNSEAFLKAYDGSVVLEKADPAWLLTESGAENQWAVVEGAFHFSSAEDDDAANYVFWVLPDVEWADFPREKGFTLEVAMKPDSGRSMGINLAAAEEVGAGYAVLKVNEDSVQWAQGDGQEMMVLNSENNSDDFHVFRIAKLPSFGGEPGLYNVYRDGELIGEDLGGSYVLQKVPANRLYLGDVGTWDSAGTISFVRWDNSGAYAPENE